MRREGEGSFVDDRPQDGYFGVARSIFTDDVLFEKELAQIFEGTWVFIGLETQLPHRHAFFTTHIGRQPILVTRNAEGVVCAFLNTCRHRGSIVCPFRRGTQKVHVCRYHGWSYDSGGRNMVVANEKTGQYDPGFARAGHDLIGVARLESYRGLLFASLNPDVPPLDVYLDDAKVFLDLVLDQSPTGQIEFIPGDVSYVFDGNWKLQLENGMDFYHFHSTHGAYIDIVQQRFHDVPASSDDAEDGPALQGSFNFRNGHAVNWSIKNSDNVSGRRPLNLDLEAVEPRVGPMRAKWMLRQRNLTIFPNLQVIDVQSSQIRTWRPLSAGRTEITSHCMGVVGESPAARRMRIRNYQDFFNPTGLASSDDNVMFEYCQTGYGADAGPTQGYRRGLASPTDSAKSFAGELGISPVESALGELAFGGETIFRSSYREWRRLMADGKDL